MRSHRLLPSVCLALTSGLAGAGCANVHESSSTGGSSNGETTPTPTPGPTSSAGDARRVIAEADIIQLDGGRLYALSKSGTVSVVDVSAPGVLTLLGQTMVAGQPFEMYRRGGALVVMSNGAQGPDGSTVPATDKGTGTARATGTAATTTTATGSGAVVSVIDVEDPARLRSLASLSVPGEIADSRVVGNILYLATYENAACYRCGPAPRTMVTSFDIATTADMRQVGQVSFQSNAPDGYNLPWGSGWKRSIFVTDQRLYIGGHADIDPQSFGATANEGIIDVIDVTDPQGRLGVGARIMVAGAVLSRWQLDERDGILRVISQQGAGRTGNGIGAPEVNTFRIDSTRSFSPLGHMTMALPRPEGLRTVRFDGARAYAITYNQTDPLFVIDLADPTRPVQRGALFMPGFMFHLEPHGDRVIGLGIDRTDPQGSLNVSLFDVSEPDQPRMLKRVAFATPGITEDYAILNSEVSEDQDRIQKSFRVLPGGLVVAPFTALQGYSAAPGSSCDNAGGGVQLVEWSGDTLRKRALLPLPGNPRRALDNGNELIAVSDSNVRSFSLTDLDVAHETADLVIGACTTSSATPPSYDGRPIDHVGAEYPPACSIAPGRGPRGLGDWWPALIALAALMARHVAPSKGRPR
jgi:hypothetical protein